MTTQLNPEQQAAVEHLGSPLMVLAGAGSGKTRVITQKIEWLIKNKAFASNHIAAITFTNKAAREMKHRMGQILNKEDMKGLIVSTFHTLGLTIFRQEYKNLGYKAGFTIFDAQDALSILKDLAHKKIAEEDMDEEIKQVVWTISRWKNDFIQPEQALEIAQTGQDIFAARLYEHYARQLKAYNAVDFDDLIMLPVLLLKNYPAIIEKWQHKIRYMLIDEYQDTNACQYELIRLLAGVRGGFTAVGDDDQSIYAWRGAKPENIDQLHKDFPTLKVIKLEQNYRSTERILNTANRLIANNPHLIDKRLWSNLGEGEKITIMPCTTVEKECAQVTTQLMKIHFQENAKWKDFAILYRSNHQSRPLEALLRQNRIDYKITGGTSFFERAEIKDILAYMRLMANPDDDAAFLRVINTPKREIGVATLEKLGDYASERGKSLFAASREMGFSTRVSSRARDRLAYFTDWAADFKHNLNTLSPQQAVQRIITDINYEDWLRNTSQSTAAAKRANENLSELIGWVSHLNTTENGKDKETLADIVNHLALVDMLERNTEDDEEENAVHLMTLHAAKGLEFPYVFMIGVEEELLPHANSLDDDHGLQEERRLTYVGITRAQRQLFISFAKTRRRFGEDITCEPSRFLDELPEENVYWQDKSHQPDPEQQQRTAQSYIANLQEMLKG